MQQRCVVGFIFCGDAALIGEVAESRGPEDKPCSQVAWVQIPPLPLSGYGTLEKTPDNSELFSGNNNKKRGY